MVRLVEDGEGLLSPSLCEYHQGLGWQCQYHAEPRAEATSERACLLSRTAQGYQDSVCYVPIESTTSAEYCTEAEVIRAIDAPLSTGVLLWTAWRP